MGLLHIFSFFVAISALSFVSACSDHITDEEYERVMSDPYKLHGRVTFTPQSPLMDGCNTFTPGSPHRSPTPLVRGDNRPVRLILIPKQPRVHHLESKLVPFLLKKRLCLAPFPIQVVCVPYVRE
ncbi:hypothetical protein TNCV_4288581 [Trichonephila clavipes]|nr:hypothetical protein TNCV_4288581 [Trichonephila clavipes]